MTIDLKQAVAAGMLFVISLVPVAVSAQQRQAGAVQAKPTSPSRRVPPKAVVAHKPAVMDLLESASQLGGPYPTEQAWAPQVEALVTTMMKMPLPVPAQCAEELRAIYGYETLRTLTAEDLALRLSPKDVAVSAAVLKVVTSPIGVSNPDTAASDRAVFAAAGQALGREATEADINKIMRETPIAVALSVTVARQAMTRRGQAMMRACVGQ